MKNKILFISAIVVFVISILVLIVYAVNSSKRTTYQPNNPTIVTNNTTNDINTSNSNNNVTTTEENQTDYYIEKYDLSDTSIERKPVKKYNLTTDDVSKLEEYLKEVREPTAEEMVDLSIIGEVKLVYKDGIVLYFDNISEGFCTYSSKESDNSSLRIVPKEFFDWVMNKIDNS